MSITTGLDGSAEGASTEDERRTAVADAPERVDGTAGGGRLWRRVVSLVVSVLAFGFVMFALVTPNKVQYLTPAAFARVPVEGLLGVALVLVLPARARRVAAVLGGVVLGLLAIVKLVDLGFDAVLARPFNLVYDWSMLSAAVEFLQTSIGQAGAIASVAGVVLLAGGVLALMTSSLLRLTRLVTRYGTAAAGTAGALGVAWVVCALLGTQLVPGVPVAALAYERLLQVPASLADREAFAKQVGEDAFKNVPGDGLLTALRGKDVVFAFVESYGRDAIEDPEFASGVGAVLADGERRLRAAGFSSRSAFLTSPTFGGGSWFAHATLLSGLWVDSQQRHADLMTRDRLTLNSAFRKAGWRTVGVMPGVHREWPEGAFYKYDRVYAADDLGYRGPGFTWGTIPDQYTLSAFQRLERARADRAPVMAEIPLVSSHAPWTPIPRLLGWKQIGDGRAYYAMAGSSGSLDNVWSDVGRVRGEYRRSIEYSLGSLLSYVETYGDDDLVLVFLGDHQPAPIITGVGADRDVPITIVAKDPAVLDRISGWGWQDGLKPGPKAPVWRMDAFRDRFLTAFGSHPTR
ncbi:sulfatase [Thermopolyspora sp. NPDC052614]|uniref:sulfatase n=1 Tax=Thermopolyspora sp. NPDC052614 TaxID=3155682 RepID=UPI00341CCF6B